MAMVPVAPRRRSVANPNAGSTNQAPLRARVLGMIQDAKRGWAFPATGNMNAFPERLPSSQGFDYARKVGAIDKSSIVMGIVQWIQRVYTEAPVMVRKKDGKRLVPNHRLSALLESPNDFYDGGLLLQATVADYNITGNSYWLKVRNSVDAVVQLWWIPSWMIRPAWPIDGTEYITKYIYEIYRQRFLIDPRDVVHFRFGMDPNNIRTGRSPLVAEVRHIFTDNESADFSAALVRNLGIPGVIIAPAPQGGDERTIFADPEEVKRKFMDKFGGSRRGEPMVLDGPTMVHVLSFSPEQMNLKDLRRLPEERISVALGVHPMVTGLGAGLDRSTFTNYGDALDAAYKNNILPTQRTFARVLSRQLLPDLGTPTTEEVFFDNREVAALQPDRTALYTSITTAYKGDWMKLGEGRRLAGIEDTDENDDLFYSEVQAKLKEEAAQANQQRMMENAAQQAALNPAGVAGPLGAGQTSRQRQRQMNPGSPTPGGGPQNQVGTTNNRPQGAPSQGNRPAPGNQGSSGRNPTKELVEATMLLGLGGDD